jgi:putative transcriptional regulator
VVGEPDVLFRGGPVGTDSALAVARLAEGSEPVGWRPLFDGTGLIDLDTPREVIVPALHGIRIYAGYAGWGAGQLEAEVEEGAWYVVAAAPDDLFDATPDGLWRRVLRRQPEPLSWLATYPADPTQN